MQVELQRRFKEFFDGINGITEALNETYFLAAFNGWPLLNFMFGLFKKREVKSLPPLPQDSAAGTTPNYDAILLASIVKLKAGDESVLPAFFESLSRATIFILCQEPQKIQTALLLEFSDHLHIAVFTKLQLSEKWQSQGYPHSTQIPMRDLAAQVSNDAVGLTINPEHPIFGIPIPPAGFKHFRDVLASQKPPLKEGGLYYVRNDDGTYSPLKILKLDEIGAHVRQYSNSYPMPPKSLDESNLYMAGQDRPAGEKLGIGHVPISKKNFGAWNPTFLQQSSVSEEELEGYKMWLEAKGGYF